METDRPSLKAGSVKPLLSRGRRPWCSPLTLVLLLCCLWAFIWPSGNPLSAATKQDQEFWDVIPDYNKFCPDFIAVLPMDNFSLEPGLETVLYNTVYEQLQAKGYRRVSVEKVREVMKEMGIQTSGQLQGISLKRLQEKLNADAVLLGQVDQSADIHKGVYDAVVVSCSLKLIHCQTGTVLWSSEQWRAAHRQWAIDPFNMLLNVMAHSSASRSDRIAWLVQEMLKTLPAGKVTVEVDNLLDQAVQIQGETK
ncbi:MAG: GNA1162 family protein [Pseudomonadota bacterium]